MNGPSPISLAYLMMKLCVEIAFVPHAHLVYKAGEKILPFFQYKCIMQIIHGLKRISACLSTLPLAIDTHDEAF